MKSYLITALFALLCIGCKQETQITIVRDSVVTVTSAGQTTTMQLATQALPATAIAVAQPTAPATTAPAAATVPAVANGRQQAVAPTTTAKQSNIVTPAGAGVTTPTQKSATAATPVATTPTATITKANTQATYKVGGKSSLTLQGTSTLHDWTMTATAFTGNATLDVPSGNQLTSVSAMTLSLPVHNLKSESSSMDNNAYSSLKADQYSNIAFALTSATVSASGVVSANGNLTIAGATHAISFSVASKVNADGSVNCTGSVPIKLSDYKIDRPSFMLGAMKVGDAMTLQFALVLVK